MVLQLVRNLGEIKNKRNLGKVKLDDYFLPPKFKKKTKNLEL
jgi:hypothetical protein